MNTTERKADVLANSQVKTILLEPIFPHVDECRICGCEVVLRTFGPNYGIAMYEDLPVPPEWDGEWGGFTACKECHDRYERRELPMWTVEELTLITSNAAALTRIGGAQ